MKKSRFLSGFSAGPSYAITKRLHRLVSIILDQNLTILTSKQLQEEIANVLARPKFKKYIKHSDIAEVMAIHLKLCRIVVVNDTVSLLTDPKDNFLISLYKTGNATFLVSGDKELLHEASNLGCRVMTLKEFELIGQ
ncbi:MAG: putative toxin-antitoxin system toxin component, PIN family [Lentimicrobium sp.]